MQRWENIDSWVFLCKWCVLVIVTRLINDPTWINIVENSALKSAGLLNTVQNVPTYESSSRLLRAVNYNGKNRKYTCIIRDREQKWQQNITVLYISQLYCFTQPPKPPWPNLHFLVPKPQFELQSEEYANSSSYAMGRRIHPGINSGRTKSQVRNESLCQSVPTCSVDVSICDCPFRLYRTD